MGIDLRTGQYILRNSQLKSIQYSRTLLRLPEVENGIVKKMSSVAMTPWSMHKESEPHVRFPEREVAEGEVRPDDVRPVRRIYIKQSDLDRYGYTTGCPKCEDIIRGATKSTVNHSDTCRKRIEAKLAETEEGRTRLGAATERSERFLEQKRSDAATTVDRKHLMNPRGRLDDVTTTMVIIDL